MTGRTAQNASDDLECAYIKLKGATERLMLLLEYRSEDNYAIASAAVAVLADQWHRLKYPYPDNGSVQRESSVSPALYDALQAELDHPPASILGKE